MGTVALIALIALLAVGAVAVVVLATPVHVKVALRTADRGNDPSVRVTVEARWLGFRRQIDVVPRATPPPGAPLPLPKPDAPRAHARRVRRLSLPALLRAPGFAVSLRRVVSDLARALRPASARGVVRFGLEDPAATGEVFGWLQCAVWPLRDAGARLRVEPVFDAPAFSAEADLTWHVRPASVVRPLARFGLSPATWRAFRAARRARAA